jgi:hypothetical protein
MTSIDSANLSEILKLPLKGYGEWKPIYTALGFKIIHRILCIFHAARFTQNAYLKQPSRLHTRVDEVDVDFGKLIKILSHHGIISCLGLE